MASEYPEYPCYALAADAAFWVPIWRHVHAWLGTEACTKTNFHRWVWQWAWGGGHVRGGEVRAWAGNCFQRPATQLHCGQICTYRTQCWTLLRAQFEGWGCHQQ
jgi:hypothetical protein